jgi:hypothetical protein
MHTSDEKNGLANIAYLLSLAAGAVDAPSAKQRLELGKHNRAKVDQRRKRQRQLRQEKPLVDAIADRLLMSFGALQAKINGIDLSGVPPAVAGDLMPILNGVLADLPLASDHAIGFPYHRLLKANRDNESPSAQIITRAIRFARKRSNSAPGIAKQKAAKSTSGKKCIHVIHSQSLQDVDRLREQLRAARNRLRTASLERMHPGDLPEELVTAVLEWVLMIRSEFPGFAAEVVSLGRALEMGIPSDRATFARGIVDKLFEILIMPPDPLRDLFFETTEWR